VIFLKLKINELGGVIMPEVGDSNFFSNLKDFGLDSINDISIYENKEEDTQSKKEINAPKPADSIFDKKLTCPVCNRQITVRAVKSGSIRILSRDTDFMVYYQEPNPSFYDAILCTYCGYAALSTRFGIVSDKQAKLIKENISYKWNFNNTYPQVYDVNVAIELHQLALLNCVVKNGSFSEKAITCLRLAWLYRLKKDESNEKKFLFQAQQGFIKAFEKETFPIVGLDEPSVEYLIGELYRRLGDNKNAILWFSRVLGSKIAKPKIKDMARDQKDAIRLQENNFL
jgi:uncharacterized protein (DUF2225 family)